MKKRYGISPDSKREWKLKQSEIMGIKSYGPKQRVAATANAFFLQLLLLLLYCILLVWIGSSDCALLPADEVNALVDMAKELGKNDWKPVVTCEDDISWRQRNVTYANESNCTCTGSVCHMVNISLKGQSLAGVLPTSLQNLTHIKRFDLSRNFLNGTIPQEWASLPLEYLSLFANRLSGRIPDYLGKFTTLSYLSIENNGFYGPVPAQLGKLVNLKSLVLSANYLTGQLPNALKSLSKLTELRINSNNFSGKIPDYFQSWTELERLEIQGSGFKGPIPSSISNLTHLVWLRISDLDGDGSSDFPNLESMTNLTYLMLRNCNISGSIPPYLPNLYKLKSLDLSFNNLEGPIPVGLENLKMNYVYLTYNFLDGAIPDWITASHDNIKIDLSYNNFSESSVPSSCNNNNLNLFRSSSRKLNSSLAGCLENKFNCSSHNRNSLHINCGGNEIKVGKTIYEADNLAGGPATFIPTNADWGFSSTGHFWDVNYTGDYTVLNPALGGFYSVARISAISLTYYGRCLAKGNYTVILYFEEIIFTNDRSFYSLGRRIFDVYIQEKLVLRDFDISKAANGSERVHYETFPQISVEDSGTIEIRFYYAGKGTTGVPTRGTYGPLVSAISVKSEFNPPDRKRIMKIVLGSSASVIFLIIIASGAFIWRHRQRNRPSREEVLRGIDLQTVHFTYQQIKAATDNFDPANKIGEGGFGSVYKGTLLDGTCIAVKRLSSKSSQGNREFVTEIGTISGLHHPNLTKLYGCCVEGSQLFLVYEFMVNNNLARALFDEDWPLRLDWPTRQKICSEIAKGLVFLHDESAIKIVHRDIKPTNVLLDENLNAKISDFGLARLREEEDTHISTRVAGTVGYMSPEYALWGYLTYKADVYSFGVVALEIVAGRSNMDFQPDEDIFCLLDWAVVQQRRGNLIGIIDAKLGTEYNKEEAVRMIKIALLCTSATPALRPRMCQVVSMLQGNLDVQIQDSLTHSSAAYGWMVQHQHQTSHHQELLTSTETQSLVHSSV